ncbi:protein FAM53B-like isoform X2 [Esox lucius]|uniref:Family with sequence similarity 53 member B n=1 Tax=Esox lucius TaxID=8010 RepID=A0A3P8XLA7_ESOLU|nr:protein FAM53B-like isoform X2 [Esox lucius]
MVIILTKTLQKKNGVNDVRSRNTESFLPRELHTMSRGTTLFSCGTVEADRWLELGRGCAVQPSSPCQSGPSLKSLWDILPKECQQRSRIWDHEVGTATDITSRIRDLNVSDAKFTATHSLPLLTSKAPPSKRQCRSLSFSEEFEGCRSSWRRQGSRVWTEVEKRRCHSGGSVQHCSQGGVLGGGVCSREIPTIQRSSSLSLPSCSNNPTNSPLELPCFTQHLPLYHQFNASPPPPSHQCYLRPLSLSHEQICLPENHRQESSSPDSPELGSCSGRRARGKGGLSRSKSQPCVLNDKKIGMKRRRPEDTQESRPSLDLAKMTQRLQTFHSLSCPGCSGLDTCQSNLHPLFSRSWSQTESDFCPSDLGTETHQEVDDEEEDSSYEELDSDSACSLDSRNGSPSGEGGVRMGSAG